MATPQVAYVAGACGQCGRTIAKGDAFQWGKARGEKIHAPSCLSMDAPMPSLPRAVREFAPSAAQLAIREALDSTHDNLMISAVAGSGKTSTIEWLIRECVVPSGASYVYLVFNKRNQEQARERGIDAVTLNALGYRMLTGKYEIQRDKVRDIWRALSRQSCDETLTDALGEDGESIARLCMEKRTSLTASIAEVVSNPLRLIGLAKGLGLGITGLIEDTPAEWSRIGGAYDITFEMPPYPPIPLAPTDIARWRAADWETAAIALLQRALHASNTLAEESKVIDFDDQLYLPLLWNIRPHRYDYVFVDEVQDLNAVQHEHVQRIVTEGARLIAVGDRRQAIYAFRGAQSDGMDRLKEQFNCRELPLDVSYRCARLIVASAREFCPEIHAAPAAPDGVCETRGGLDMDTLHSTDAILSRATAPLIREAYSLIQRQIPCRVLGRDIGQGLIAVITTIIGRKTPPASVSMSSFVPMLIVWRTRELERRKEDLERCESIRDKVESIEAVAESLPLTACSVADLIQHIDELFSDRDETGQRTEVLTLSTVHKAKGLEWDTVYILNADTLGKPRRNRRDDEQERNIAYVARTRAQRRLVHISSPIKTG